MDSLFRTTSRVQLTGAVLAAVLSAMMGVSRLAAQIVNESGPKPEVRPNAAATQPADVQQEQPAPAYTVGMTAQHVARIAQSPFVSPTASGDRNLVIGRTKGSQEHAIPPLDLLACKIANAAAQGAKVRVVLMTGNHNTEHTGSWAFEGVIDFLLSDSPEAAALRRKAVFYVYPLVNPEGRFTGRGRGNAELAAAGHKDHNRLWNTSGQAATIDILTTAIRKDTGGSTDFFVDFHSTGSTFFYIARQESWSSFGDAVTARDPAVKPRAIKPGAGTTMGWAASKEGLSANVSVTAELADKLSAARCRDIGRAYGLALYDLIVAGEGKADSPARVATTGPDDAAGKPAAGD